MNKLSVVFCGALLAASTGVNAAPNIVVNGGFEADTISGAYEQLAAVTGWNSDGVFEIQRGSDHGGWTAFNAAYEGEQYLELNSTTLTSIWQGLNTTVGQTYNLSFAYSGRSDTPGELNSAFEVYWGGTQLVASSTPSDSGWVTYSFSNLLATSNLTDLRFVSTNPQGAPSYGSFLDGVVVTAVPEPSTYGMLALGLGVIGFLGRRERKSMLS
ncbi:DUF642 domain-containing protein [Methylobacillus gramineus]|uniref:PEP-CTERM sorting domain-containing protein n=1 Tax=Methylobacillus gramineus TaxID=755169 RepID=UPI001CFFAED6|nr:PEP-CTERM sorting domain-containing protein [Methylobacillus gramineus]MCB5184646.1 DUF642 domain-containing protein [Methylobacillus gramineus]